MQTLNKHGRNSIPANNLMLASKICLVQVVFTLSFYITCGPEVAYIYIVLGLWNKTACRCAEVGQPL